MNVVAKQETELRGAAPVGRHPPFTPTEPTRCQSSCQEKAPTNPTNV